MKIAALITASMLILSSPIMAKSQPKSHNVLDQVILQVYEEQWVKTNQAKVNILVNATLEKDALAKARQEIRSNLQRIAKGDWHITQFMRSQDSSGLETVEVRAEARLDESALSNLHQAAKAMSKPGASYQVESIDFTPSAVELADARSKLRTAIYQKINDEIAQLNTVYTTQQYQVHKINFIEGYLQHAGKARGGAMDSSMYALPIAPAVTVSNKLSKTALVVLASNRKTDA